MRKPTLKAASFFQAAGIAAYIMLFASTVQYFGHRYGTLQPNPLFSMALFLITFVFSAAICSAIFLGYPAYLFFEGKKREAVRLILGSIAWLAVFLVAFLVLIFLTAVR